MRAGRAVFCGLAVGLVCCAPGCSWLPNPAMTALEAQNRALAEQNRAAMAEIANLRSHARTVEDQLQTAEQDLAASEDRAGLQGQQLANYRREREELHEQFRGVAQLLSRRGAETPANPY